MNEYDLMILPADPDTYVSEDEDRERFETERAIAKRHCLIIDLDDTE